MEFKRGTPHDLKLSDEGTISLAFAQLDVIDKDGDVTLTGAIPTKDVPMSAYGHTSWDGALPVGRGAIREAAGWGVFDGRFLMETDQGRNAHATVKAMAELQEYSYGYRPTEFSFGQQDGQDVRFLRALDIFEVSPVLIGAGVGTHTLAIKRGGPEPDLPYAEHVDWMLVQWKALMDRTVDRSELRTKEGRTLSGANLDQLAAIHEQMTAIRTGLGDFMSANQPPKSADHRRAMEILVLMGEARALGIPV